MGSLPNKRNIEEKEINKEEGKHGDKNKSEDDKNAPDGSDDDDDDELLQAAAKWAEQSDPPVVTATKTPSLYATTFNRTATKRVWSLHITQLSFDASDYDIRTAFVQKGCMVTSVRLVYDNEAGIQKTFRGVAFVDVDDEVSYQKALSLHKTKLLGRRINVRPTRTTSELANIVERTKELVAEKIRQSTEKKLMKDKEDSQPSKSSKYKKKSKKTKKKKEDRNQKESKEESQAKISEEKLKLGKDKQSDKSADTNEIDESQTVNSRETGKKKESKKKHKKERVLHSDKEGKKAETPEKNKISEKVKHLENDKEMENLLDDTKKDQSKKKRKQKEVCGDNDVDEDKAMKSSGNKKFLETKPVEMDKNTGTESNSKKKFKKEDTANIEKGTEKETKKDLAPDKKGTGWSHFVSAKEKNSSATDKLAKKHKLTKKERNRRAAIVMSRRSRSND